MWTSFKSHRTPIPLHLPMGAKPRIWVKLHAQVPKWTKTMKNKIVYTDNIVDIDDIQQMRKGSIYTCGRQNMWLIYIIHADIQPYTFWYTGISQLKLHTRVYVAKRGRNKSTIWSPNLNIFKMGQQGPKSQLLFLLFPCYWFDYLYVILFN